MSIPVSNPSVTSPLQDFVAPLTEIDFRSALRQRKLTLVRGANVERYSRLLCWDALKAKISRGEYPRGADHIRVSKESRFLPPERWQKNGTVEPLKLEILLAQGFNVILTHIEPFFPELAALCADIEERLHELSYAGVIVTKGTDGAFSIHYDPEDLIILQVQGRKRWQCFGPPVPKPVRECRTNLRHLLPSRPSTSFSKPVICYSYRLASGITARMHRTSPFISASFSRPPQPWTF